MFDPESQRKSVTRIERIISVLLKEELLIPGTMERCHPVGRERGLQTV